MSSNSKEFPYELFRQMHNDLQTQMMKITQLSQAEAAASSVVNANPTTPPRQNPSMYANSYAGKPASSFTAVPQQPARQQVTEKKTFEQAYREAIERLNAAAGNRTNSQQQTLPQQQRSRVQYSKSCPRQPSPPRSVINSNRFTVEPSVSVYAPSTPGSSDSQYKTTIYNINTINLAGLVKSQQNTNDGRSAVGRSAVSTSVGSTPSAPQSQSVERIMDESHRYRETFANAYARHLLEMTRTAVQKKTAQPQKPAQGGQYSSSANQSPISSQIEPGSGHLAKPLPEADLPSKKPRKSPAANPLILNGKDGAALTFAEMLSNSERKPNGNVLLTIDRKATPGTNNPNLPSLDAMMAAHSSKSKHASSSSLEKKPIESRLKPSSIKINHDEFYRQIQNKIVQHTQKLSTPSSLPAQQRVVSGATSKVVPPRQQTVIVSTSSTSSTGQSVSPSTSHSYSMGLCTPKRNQDSAIASLVEPPPAHSTTPKSSFVSPQTSIPVKPLTPSPLPVKETMNYGAKNLNSITPKFSKPASVTAADGVLNLDTKIPTPPSSASQNNTPNIGFDDYSLQSSTQYRTTGNRSSILFNSSQKVVKIEKRVNYDAYANAKASNSDSGTSKYQHNVVWKEQPSIKSEEHLNGSGKIFEQKKTLLELLQIANMQQVSSNPQGQTKGVSFVGRIAATAGNVTTAGALQTNHMNQTNQDLFKYRMTSKSSSKEKHRKLIDPLAIKPDPDRPPVKRKDPAKRLDLVRRKKPKLARSTDPYLQHGPCYEVAPRLSRCRECGRSAAARSRDAANIFCRFIAFRKLKYNDHGQMEVAGFADPNLDAQKADTSLWDANLTKVPIDLSVEKSKFLLGQVGYKFCELFHQEKEAYFEHMSEGNSCDF
ncbi:probable JmjC domain-containing histone demethylation protein 2C isoform X2 [Ochlerotatus camptorhynchus]|uniref:probable JmjC domain-containing histone demethylation protein 2C isoform X2 n=1 Tax=Ochlerotatus camptorhynchus TaxID=644619 RepID=UPI0031DCE19F